MHTFDDGDLHIDFDRREVAFNGNLLDLDPDSVGAE